MDNATNKTCTMEFFGHGILGIIAAIKPVSWYYCPIEMVLIKPVHE